MKERFPNFSRDFHKELPDNRKDLVAQARIFVEETRDSLKDFINQIVVHKPDDIIFLDNSARIFGTPVFRYLKKLESDGKIDKVPRIRFYNDNDLKREYSKLEKGEDCSIADIVHNDFNSDKDKKIFFFDEVFSTGQGAKALIELKKILGNDQIYYFSLAYLANTDGNRNTVPEIESDDKFLVYDNVVPNLFTKGASNLRTKEYIDLERQRTITYPATNTKGNLKERKMKIPSYSAGGQRIGDIDDKEEENLKMAQDFRTSVEIRNLIYDAITN